MNVRKSQFLVNARKSNRKKWTVLVYANGNNELSPEIYGRFKSLWGEAGANILQQNTTLSQQEALEIVKQLWWR